MPLSHYCFIIPVFLICNDSLYRWILKNFGKTNLRIGKTILLCF